MNVAARLCDSAHAGEALADASVLNGLPRWGAVVAQRDVDLRGVGKPVRAANISLVTEGDDQPKDPICGLPLSDATAEVVEDADGRYVLFCSAGCLDTWMRRPRAVQTTILGRSSA